MAERSTTNLACRSLVLLLLLIDIGISDFAPALDAQERSLRAASLNTREDPSVNQDATRDATESNYYDDEIPPDPETRPKYVAPGEWAKKSDERRREKDGSLSTDFVPTKLHAQVRETRTMKRVPRDEAIRNAETEEERLNAARLREVVVDTKVNTVYTEEGYEDSAYDHAGQAKDADFLEDYERRRDGSYGATLDYEEQDEDEDEDEDEEENENEVTPSFLESDPRMFVKNNVDRLIVDVERDAKKGERAANIDRFESRKLEVEVEDDRENERPCDQDGVNETTKCDFVADERRIEMFEENKSPDRMNSIKSTPSIDRRTSNSSDEEASTTTSDYGQLIWQFLELKRMKSTTTPMTTTMPTTTTTTITPIIEDVALEKPSLLSLETVARQNNSLSSVDREEMENVTSNYEKNPFLKVRDDYNEFVERKKAKYRVLVRHKPAKSNGVVEKREKLPAVGFERSKSNHWNMVYPDALSVVRAPIVGWNIRDRTNPPLSLELLPPSPYATPIVYEEYRKKIASNNVDRRQNRRQRPMTMLLYDREKDSSPHRRFEQAVLRYLPLIVDPTREARGISRRKRSATKVTRATSTNVKGGNFSLANRPNESTMSPNKMNDVTQELKTWKIHDKLLDESPRVSGAFVDKMIEARFGGSREQKDSDEKGSSVETEIPELDYGEESWSTEDEDRPRISTSIVVTTAASVDSKKYPFYEKKLVPAALRYAVDPKYVPRKTAGGMEFYESRDAYKLCPDVEMTLLEEQEVIPKEKEPVADRGLNEDLPRLRGLGDKLDCLKAKYFDADPFDDPLFLEERVAQPVVPPELDVREFSKRISISRGRRQNSTGRSDLPQKLTKRTEHVDERRPALRLSPKWSEEKIANGERRTRQDSKTKEWPVARSTTTSPYQRQIYEDVMEHIRGSTDYDRAHGAIRVVPTNYPSRGKFGTNIDGLTPPKYRNNGRARVNHAKNVSRRTRRRPHGYGVSGTPAQYRKIKISKRGSDNSKSFLRNATTRKRGRRRRWASSEPKEARHRTDEALSKISKRPKHKEVSTTTTKSIERAVDQEKRRGPTEKVVYTIADRIQHSKRPKEATERFGEFSREFSSRAKDGRRREPRYNVITRKSPTEINAFESSTISFDGSSTRSFIPTSTDDLESNFKTTTESSMKRYEVRENVEEDVATSLPSLESSTNSSRYVTAFHEDTRFAPTTEETLPLKIDDTIISSGEERKEEEGLDRYLEFHKKSKGSAEEEREKKEDKDDEQSSLSSKSADDDDEEFYKSSEATKDGKRIDDYESSSHLPSFSSQKHESGEKNVDDDDDDEGKEEEEEEEEEEELEEDEDEDSYENKRKNDRYVFFWDRDEGDRSFERYEYPWERRARLARERSRRRKENQRRQKLREKYSESNSEDRSDEVDDSRHRDEFVRPSDRRREVFKTGKRRGDHRKRVYYDNAEISSEDWPIVKFSSKYKSDESKRRSPLAQQNEGRIEKRFSKEDSSKSIENPSINETEIVIEQSRGVSSSSPTTKQNERRRKPTKSRSNGASSDSMHTKVDDKSRIVTNSIGPKEASFGSAIIQGGVRRRKLPKREHGIIVATTTASGIVDVTTDTNKRKSRYSTTTMTTFPAYLTTASSRIVRRKPPKITSASIESTTMKAKTNDETEYSTPANKIIEHRSRITKESIVTRRTYPGADAITLTPANDSRIVDGFELPRLSKRKTAKEGEEEKDDEAHVSVARNERISIETKEASDSFYRAKEADVDGTNKASVSVAPKNDGNVRSSSYSSSPSSLLSFSTMVNDFDTRDDWAQKLRRNDDLEAKTIVGNVTGDQMVFKPEMNLSNRHRAVQLTEQGTKNVMTVASWILENYDY